MLAIVIAFCGGCANRISAGHRTGAGSVVTRYPTTNGAPSISMPPVRGDLYGRFSEVVTSRPVSVLRTDVTQCPILLTGTVETVGAPRYATPDNTRPTVNPSLPFIFTPYTIVVTQVMRGAEFKVGGTAEIYIEGGTIGSDSLVGPARPALYAGSHAVLALRPGELPGTNGAFQDLEALSIDQGAVFLPADRWTPGSLQIDHSHRAVRGAVGTGVWVSLDAFAE